MEYTVKQLARLAGVSVRTLHWYHQIGLLAPARVTAAGYRVYGPAQVDALQSILLYRALGVPLKHIGPLLAAAPSDRLAQLQAHRGALLAQRARLDELLHTLDKTIQAEKGECIMTDAEKFAGFKEALIRENEARYGAEARAAYGEQPVEQANARLRGMTETAFQEMQALEEQIKTRLAAAVRANADPAGAQGQHIAALHRQWLLYSWPTYTAAAHRGLADLYVADSRFTDYYDAETPGCAAFLRAAVRAYTRREG